jgi:predicted GIY-YIG superfamily endonuclease
MKVGRGFYFREVDTSPNYAKASFGWPNYKYVRFLQSYMWYVYFLKSINRNFIYTGSTNDLKNRFREHNDGECLSSKAYRPLELKAYIAVLTERKARELEKYFKTGFGKVILKKRILTTEATK